MKLLTDENCDAVLIARLHRAGHNILRVVDVARGSSDQEVIRIAIKEDRVLLTNDTDFGLLAERSEMLPPAIVLMRLGPLRAAARAEIVVAFLAGIGEAYRGKFFVIEPGTVRQRALEAPE